MPHAGSFTIDATHAALPGHFPGRPIVPGVVLLDHVAALLLNDVGRRVAGFPSARFLHPVRPGDTVSVAYDGPGFTCTVGGTAVLTGRIDLAARP